MTDLATFLAARIRDDGPMTVASYMAECLLHPTMGYYTTRAPFGAKGDFTTAPEISQMFGELVGLCLAQAWLDQGAPAPFTLAELGPGRGTLMADILRATRRVPGFHAAMQVTLVEASPALRAVQAQTLADVAVDWPIDWLADSHALPEAPLFLVANEFFDALPIHQYVKDEAGWRERLVGLHGDALAFGLSEVSPHPDLTARFGQDAPGTLVEYSPLAQHHINAVKHRIHHHGGLALIVDYGGWQSKGDTLQAVKDHGFADPLAEPGRADLTAHVDFHALAGLWHPYYTTQGAFLTALGINARAERLARGLTGAALENHLAAHHRLTDAMEMGSIFKVLALTRPDTPPPGGFV